jgi:hypothetical protein
VSRIIEIFVSAKGETTVTTKGFAGSDCQQASKFMEDALGQRTGEQLTAEFYHASNQHQQQLREGQ